MRLLSAGGEKAIAAIARRHGFGIDATRHMLDAVSRGGGGMAQFDHPEFSGAGQWMRGGMTMVSDMFDHHLKGRVDGLCQDLASLLAEGVDVFDTRAPQGSSNGRFQPAERAATSGDWWPEGLGHPNSAGSQNGIRYAYFARARRLAIERGGVLTLHDTGDHAISGVSQQQGGSGTLRFESQHGPVDVAGLPKIAPDAGPSFES